MTNILLIVEDASDFAQNLTVLAAEQFDEIVVYSDRRNAQQQILALKARDANILLLCDAAIPDSADSMNAEALNGPKVAMFAHMQLGDRITIKGIGLIQDQWNTALTTSDSEWIGKDLDACRKAINSFLKRRNGSPEKE